MSAAIFSFGADRTIFVDDGGDLGGSAKRFSDALRYRIGDIDAYVRGLGGEGQGGWFFNFIRGSIDARPLSTRDQRLSASYLYDVSPAAATIKAFRLGEGDDGESAPIPIFAGSLPDFINWGMRKANLQCVAKRKPERFSDFDFVGQAIHAPWGVEERLIANQGTALALAAAYETQARSFPDGHRLKSANAERASSWRAVAEDAQRQYKNDQAA